MAPAHQRESPVPQKCEVCLRGCSRAVTKEVLVSKRSYSKTSRRVVDLIMHADRIADLCSCKTAYPS